MIRQRIPAVLMFTSAFLFLGTLIFIDRQATCAAQPAAEVGSDKDAVAAQIKELQKQVAELQGQVRELKSPRIVAVGTTTVKLGAQQENRANIRVKLPANLAAKLGSDCTVQLTNRCPASGSFFVPYWKPTADGFEITLIDPPLTGTAIYPHPNTYYVDWIVVQK